MTADTLEVVAGKINALSDKLGKAVKDVRQYRVTRNQLIVEAHQRVTDGEVDIGWEEWITDNLTINRNAVYKILRLEGSKIQDENGIPEYQNDAVDPEEDWTGTVPGTDVHKPETPRRERANAELTLWQLSADDLLWVLQQQSLNLPPAQLRRLFATVKAAIDQDAGKPAPAPKPAPARVDPRVQNAVAHFFETVPIQKRLWVQQRMEEQPTTHKVAGPHIDWIRAFWDSTPEQQLAIREGVKLENTRRQEG